MWGGIIVSIFLSEFLFLMQSYSVIQGIETVVNLYMLLQLQVVADCKSYQSGVRLRE